MADETLHSIRLLGQPTLQHHLDFVYESVVDGSSFVRSDLVNDWRRANDYYAELEQREANFADDIDIYNLDESLDPLVQETMKDFRYQYTFDKLPTRFAMVELDRMVVSQTHVNREFTDNLIQKLSPEMDLKSLFYFCLPPTPPNQEVKVRQIGSKRFVFSSDSSDFRAHNPTILKPEQILDHTTFGPLSGMVGLGAGFGSNFLTGIQAEGRILLHNGYHRAYALRCAGITHAPCIIQSASRLDELEIAAKATVIDDADFFFGSARPPVLKDFFDKNICKEFEIYKTQKIIEVTYNIQEYQVRV